MAFLTGCGQLRCRASEPQLDPRARVAEFVECRNCRIAERQICDRTTGHKIPCLLSHRTSTDNCLKQRILRVVYFASSLRFWCFGHFVSCAGRSKPSSINAFRNRCSQVCLFVSPGRNSRIIDNIAFTTTFSNSDCHAMVEWLKMPIRLIT